MSRQPKPKKKEQQPTTRPKYRRQKKDPAAAPKINLSPTEPKNLPNPSEPKEVAKSAETPETLAGAGSPPSPPPPTDDPTTSAEPHPNDKSMGLLDHLNELRQCLIKATIALFIGFVACFIVVDPIFNALVDPLLAALPKGSHAIYTTLPEGFFTRMFIAFVAGLFASSPVFFYQIWSFIAPGLYDEEKRFILPVAFISAIFFIGGALFCYHIVFPFAFSFFVSFATDEIVAMPKVSEYLDFVLKLLLAFGLIFEMPLFAFFLSRMGLITADMMRSVRRYAILIIFIVAAILTPPDVVSQLLMAGPMLLLYELSIFIAAMFGKKKKAKEEKTEDNQA